MSKIVYIADFSNLMAIKTLSSNHRMYNLYTKFAKILEICKKYSENLVNESENQKQEIWQSFFRKSLQQPCNKMYSRFIYPTAVNCSLSVGL